MLLCHPRRVPSFLNQVYCQFWIKICNDAVCSRSPDSFKAWICFSRQRQAMILPKAPAIILFFRIESLHEVCQPSLNIRVKCPRLFSFRSSQRRLLCLHQSRQLLSNLQHTEVVSPDCVARDLCSQRCAAVVQPTTKYLRVFWRVLVS